MGGARLKTELDGEGEARRWSLPSLSSSLFHNIINSSLEVFNSFSFTRNFRPLPFAQEIKFKKSLFRNNIWMTRSGVEELELLSKMHTNPTPARPATSNPFP